MNPYFTHEHWAPHMMYSVPVRRRPPFHPPCPPGDSLCVRLNSEQNPENGNRLYRAALLDGIMRGGWVTEIFCCEKFSYKEISMEINSPSG